MSMFLPEIIQQLQNPEIKTIFISGCGGGFDFVHCACLIPELKRLKKNIIIGSYSFGDLQKIDHENPNIYYSENSLIYVKKVTSASEGDPYYSPEISLCKYFDETYPNDAKHWVYAYNARSFTIKRLHNLYHQIVIHHEVDAILLFDGGSDSLMRGNENGLGDPIEDAVSIGAIAKLTHPRILLKALLSIGLGCDRFNDVSDASSLRSIAELTRLGGYLGCFHLTPTNPGFQYYMSCVEYLYNQFPFRSVISGCILSSALGHFGFEIPESLLNSGRVNKGDVYLWPLMSIVWSFDINIIAQRSLVIPWIQDAITVSDMFEKLQQKRREMKILKIENLPRHEDMSIVYAHQRELISTPTSNDTINSSEKHLQNEEVISSKQCNIS